MNVSQHHFSRLFFKGIEVAKFTLLIVLVALPLLIVSESGKAQSVVNSDSVDIPTAEFGEIPDSLLSMQQYGPDPSADYFYAFKEARISFDEDEKSIIANLEYHVRIKVFNEDARQASIIGIPYYFRNDIEVISDIRGYTYQPDGSRVELSEDQIRTINLNSRYNVKEFTMPQVQDGSVIEYSYKIQRRYIEELPDFYLSHQAPTAVARVTIRYPEYLRYDVMPINFDGSVDHIEQRIDTSSVPRVFSIPRPTPLVLDHWVARDVPALEEESFISSIDDYRGKLKFQLDEFGLPRQKLENSWEVVVAQVRQNQDPWQMIGQFERARQLGEDIAGEFSRLQQAQDSIFHYLNTNARYSGMQGAYSEVPEDSVLSGRAVDQPAINQVLIAMLRGAGIEAWPLYISSRNYGRVNRSFPSYFQFNSMLVYSEIDEQGYFMDGSYAHSYPNLIPVESYNENGLLLGRDSYRWVDIHPDNSIFSISIDMDAQLFENGDLSGSFSTTQFGYPARVIREKHANGDNSRQILQSTLFDGYTDISFENIGIEDLHLFGDSVRISGDFTISEYATSYTNELEYRPLVVGYLMSNPFDDGTRDLPITLDAPEKLDLTFRVELPDGYSLGQGSQNRSVQLPGAELQERYSATRQSVQYSYHIDITRKQFEPELYPQLLDLYERWVDLSNMKWRIKMN